MTAYAVGFYDIRNATWRDEYRPGTTSFVEKRGGHFLVRPDCYWEVVEVRPPRSMGMVIIELPSLRATRDWYAGPAYEPLKALGQQGSKVDMVLLESSPNTRCAE